MDRLRCVEVFIAVAQGKSFSGAAQRLGMANGNVTKHVAWLEKSLGVQLLKRSTRSVSVTESGQSVLENGRNLLELFGQVETAARTPVKAVKGILRIGTPLSFGAYHLVPLVAAFAEQHPEVQVLLHYDDGLLDVVDEGLDLTLRIAPSLKDTNFVAQKLMRVPQYLVASPVYLKARGTPRKPADLHQHDCLVSATRAPTGSWVFEGPEGRQAVQVNGVIRANFGAALHYAAVMGQGIAMHPTYMIAQDLHHKRLHIVLPEYRLPDLDIYALYPSRRNLPVRVRIFLDFMKNWLETVPEWRPRDGLSKR